MKVPTRVTEARFRDPDRKRDPPLSAISGSYARVDSADVISYCLISKGVRARTRLVFHLPNYQPRRRGAHVSYTRR
jgi:hypothetical protein